MNDSLKRIVKMAIYPHPLLFIFLVPASITMLVISFTVLDSGSPLSILGYVLSAYTLLTVCLRIPDIVRLVERIKDNKYVKIYNNDARIRLIISLVISIAVNIVYGIFQLVLGIYHGTFWYTSFAVYYLLLAFMRYYLCDHVCKYGRGEDIKRELGKYIATGVVLLVMNLVLSVIIFFMVAYGRTFTHHFITTIAMAAFTFASLTTAIINAVKSGKYNSPVFSAAKAVSLTSATVSILTLETSMLTAFGDAESKSYSGIMLAMTGVVVIGVVLSIAVTMIVVGARKLKKLYTIKKEENL